jgi:peptidoglycan/LPS O-acetylase OafA/YrhL
LKKTLPGLDVLRFSLACYLVLYHTMAYYPAAQALHLSDVFRFGGCATSIFFILSGFILSHVSVETRAGGLKRVAMPRFLINRLTNIYPIHIISFLLIAALMAMTSRPFDVTLSNLDSAPPILHTMSTAEVVVNSILQVLLLQAWNPFYLSFNDPSWSLSTLLFFYLLFPIVAPRLLTLRRQWATLVAMWIACVLPAMIAVTHDWYGVLMMGVLHTNPLIRLPEFMAGIVAYGIFATHAPTITRTVTRHRKIIIAMLLTFFVAAALLFVRGPRAWQVLLHNGAILPAQVALIFVAATLCQRVSPRVAVWTRRLGNASLPMFALQIPLFVAFSKVQRAFGIPYSFMSCVHQVHVCTAAASRAPLHLSAYPIYLIIVLVASALFQQRIVAPLRHTLRRVMTRREESPGQPAEMLAPPVSEAR